MFLTRAIYVSQPTETIDPEKAELVLQEICQAALKRNAENGISGLLAYDCGHFVQVLEGERSVITETLIRISQDPRHTQFKLCVLEEVNARAFEDWATALISPTDWPSNHPRIVDFDCLTGDALLERLHYIRRKGVTCSWSLSDAA